MIAGIGTDIAEISRFAALLARHGQRFAKKILAPSELPEFARAADQPRFLAKRFAAKEAFGKALGTGVRAPATLPAVAVLHEASGKPYLSFAPPLAAVLAARRLVAHLSIADERAQAIAFVILEQTSSPDGQPLSIQPGEAEK